MFERGINHINLLKYNYSFLFKNLIICDKKFRFFEIEKKKRSMKERIRKENCLKLLNNIYFIPFVNMEIEDDSNFETFIDFNNKSTLRT